MNILRCTPEQLKSEAGKISLQGENLAAKVDSMISVVDSIGGAGWSGDAATAYKTQFDELKDDATRMREFLTNTSEQLNAIADQYTAAEEANAQIAHSLPTDIFQDKQWGVTQKGESSFGGLLFLFYRGLVTRDPAGSAIKGIADEAILPCYFLHEKMLKLLDILTKI